MDLLQMKFKFVKTKNIKELPKKPGVYCFKNNKIFYIGKATNIRGRVKNHFQQPSFKESIFLDKTKKIGFIYTGSEIEALILETKLIKRHQPKYNVAWKDDKNYFYAGITKEDFPQVFITHQRKQREISNKRKTEYVGPFVDGKSLKRTLKVLRKVFPYRSCKNLPQKPCLWYYIERCPAPCLIKTNLDSTMLSAVMKSECKKNARNVFKFFEKGKTKVLNDLKKEMKRVSKNQEFEKAAKIRDRIFDLEKVISNARIFGAQEKEPEYAEVEKKLKKILKTKRAIKRTEAFDISNIQGREATGSMVTFIKGKPEKTLYRKFKIRFSQKPNDIAMLKEVLYRRLQHPEWGWPDLILIDGGKAQLNAALEVLKSKKTLTAAVAKRKNELFLKERKPLLLKNLPREIFNLILQLRDEAHRFAVSYHRKIRKQKILTLK